MRIPCLLSILLVPCFSGNAQVQSIDIAAPGSTGGNYGSVRYYDPSMVGQKNTAVLNYSDIEGTPYWNEGWNPAFLFLNRGGIVKLKNVKLNLYTSDIVYIDEKGVEMEALPGMVQKVMFMSQKDTTKVLALFDAFRDSKVANGYAYYRIIADGKWKLLELKKSLIRTVPMSAMAAKKMESSFYTESSYAIASAENISPLKSLNYSNVIAVIHPDTNTEQWLKDNKNTLRKESEVVSFLNYYNLQKL